MSSGNLSERQDEREHHHAEGERHPDMPDGSVGVDHDGRGPGEHQPGGSEAFRDEPTAKREQRRTSPRQFQPTARADHIAERSACESALERF
jgi:hypothetical protein